MGIKLGGNVLLREYGYFPISHDMVANGAEDNCPMGYLLS